VTSSDLRNVLYKDKIVVRKFKEKHFGDLDVNERIILKPILKI